MFRGSLFQPPTLCDVRDQRLKVKGQGSGVQYATKPRPHSKHSPGQVRNGDNYNAHQFIMRPYSQKGQSKSRHWEKKRDISVDLTMYLHTFLFAAAQTGTWPLLELMVQVWNLWMEAGAGWWSWAPTYPSASPTACPKSCPSSSRKSRKTWAPPPAKYHSFPPSCLQPSMEQVIILEPW